MSRKSTPAQARLTRTRRAIRNTWLGSIRFPTFAVVMLVMIVVAVLVLAPTAASLAQQRQQIAQLQATVSQKESEVQALRADQARWSDNTYVITQARQRLDFVLPGEVSYLLIDDRTPAQKAAVDPAPSSQVQVDRTDWMSVLYGSLLAASGSK